MASPVHGCWWGKHFIYPLACDKVSSRWKVAWVASIFFTVGIVWIVGSVAIGAYHLGRWAFTHRDPPSPPPLGQVLPDPGISPSPLTTGGGSPPLPPNVSEAPQPLPQSPPPLLGPPEPSGPNVDYLRPNMPLERLWEALRDNFYNYEQAHLDVGPEGGPQAVARGNPVQHQYALDWLDTSAKLLNAYACGISPSREKSFSGCNLQFLDSGYDAWIRQFTGTGLDSQVFQWSWTRKETRGVTNDIPRSSRDDGHRHYYGVASQYNGAEATTPRPIPAGGACFASANDYTQGPLSQLTNRRMFELVNAASLLGMNELANVLQEKETCESLTFGYLAPKKKNLGAIFEEYKRNWRNLEQICLFSIPEGGVHPVVLILGSAPCFTGRQDPGKFDPTNEMPPADQTRDLEVLVAFSNYVTQFCCVLGAPSEQGRSPIVLHLTAHGAGAFENSPANIALGFKMAAVLFQEQLKEKNIQVQFEVFDGDRRNPAKDMSGPLGNLSVREGQRIGDPTSGSS
jgi:hypothetical protein